MKGKTTMKATKIVTLLGAVAMGAGLSGGAFAATATSNITVTASVAQKCKIDAAAIAFGAYDPVVDNATTDLNGTGTLGITCTKASINISVDLGQGLNYLGGRRMTVGGTDYLGYFIYQPSSGTAGAACAYTTVWGSTSGGSNLAVSPSGAWSASTAQNFNLCGRVPQAQDVSIGNYTDTVVATVTF